MEEPNIAVVKRGSYVSMHIRRTDKLIFDGATKTETVVRKILEESRDNLHWVIRITSAGVYPTSRRWQSIGTWQRY